MREKVLVLVVAAGAAASSLWAQPAKDGPEFPINVFTMDTQGAPSVADDGQGRFVVVWGSRIGQDGSLAGAFGRRFNGGTPIDIEFQANSYTINGQYLPRVSANSTGDFVVVWTSVGQDGSGNGVFGRRYDSAGNPTPQDFQINTITTGSQYSPDVAMDPSGGFVVVWQDENQDGDGYGVFARRFDAAAAPLDLQEVQVNTFSTGDQNAPAVAVDANGSFVVVWQSLDQDGQGYGLFGRRFGSDGVPLTSEFQINSYTMFNQTAPRVASDASGNFVVVWESYRQDGNLSGIFGRRFASGGAPLGGEFHVNTYTLGNQLSPSVAMNPSGSFVVTWDSPQDGSGVGVFAQRFTRKGVKVDAQEFQVNTYTGNRQYRSSVAMLPGDAFVVTWGSDFQDGSGIGVFAQRFTNDIDGDGISDFDDVVLTAPSANAPPLDCTDPLHARPLITWSPGNYDRFRVFISPDPGFLRGKTVTSGDTLLKTSSYTPPGRKWRSACKKAVLADPNNPILTFGVQGIDRDLPKRDPNRKTFSQHVQVAVQP